MDKQTVWMSISNAGHSGYFVWIVHEVQEGPDWKPTEKYKDIYSECLDGTYIYVGGCDHFWTKEKMDYWVNDYKGEFYLNVIEVGNSDTTLADIAAEVESDGSD